MINYYNLNNLTIKLFNSIFLNNIAFKFLILLFI